MYIESNRGYVIAGIAVVVLVAAVFVFTSGSEASLEPFMNDASQPDTGGDTSPTPSESTDTETQTDTDESTDSNDTETDSDSNGSMTGSGEASSDTKTGWSFESTDQAFYDSSGSETSSVTVPADTEVTFNFHAREDGTYYAGAEYRSPHFEKAVDPGENVTVTFTAPEDFTVEVWWPASNVKKEAELQVNVE